MGDASDDDDDAGPVVRRQLHQTPSFAADPEATQFALPPPSPAPSSAPSAAEATLPAFDDDLPTFDDAPAPLPPLLPAAPVAVEAAPPRAKKPRRRAASSSSEDEGGEQDEPAGRQKKPRKTSGKELVAQLREEQRLIRERELHIEPAPFRKKTLGELMKKLNGSLGAASPVTQTSPSPPLPAPAAAPAAAVPAPPAAAAPDFSDAPSLTPMASFVDFGMDGFSQIDASTQTVEATQPTQPTQPPAAAATPALSATLDAPAAALANSLTSLTPVPSFVNFGGDGFSQIDDSATQMPLPSLPTPAALSQSLPPLPTPAAQPLPAPPAQPLPPKRLLAKQSSFSILDDSPEVYLDENEADQIYMEQRARHRCELRQLRRGQSSEASLSLLLDDENSQEILSLCAPAARAESSGTGESSSGSRSLSRTGSFARSSLFSLKPSDNHLRTLNQFTGDAKTGSGPGAAKGAAAASRSSGGSRRPVVLANFTNIISDPVASTASLPPLSTASLSGAPSKAKKRSVSDDLKARSSLLSKLVRTASHPITFGPQDSLPLDL